MNEVYTSKIKLKCLLSTWMDCTLSITNQQLGKGKVNTTSCRYVQHCKVIPINEVLVKVLENTYILNHKLRYFTPLHKQIKQLATVKHRLTSRRLLKLPRLSCHGT